VVFSVFFCLDANTEMVLNYYCNYSSFHIMHLTINSENRNSAAAEARYVLSL
jgi:hypothetical protein